MSQNTSQDETRSDVFASTRPLLFAIAYRMLGSVTDADDLVQDTYLRWLEVPETDVRAPRAYLATIVTRLAINHMQSARSRRETYVGPWLPEPLMTEHAPDASEPVELAESLSMAFLLMLERLSPTERAVLLLHDVFDFDYSEIASIIDKSEANCRQLLARAKKHIGEPRVRFDVEPAKTDRLLNRFMEATRAGDIEGLVGVLAEDITFFGDGGGKVPGAAEHPIRGAASVARFMVDRARGGASPNNIVRAARINGQPGFVIHRNGQPFLTFVFDIRDERIHNIYAIANPDKLTTRALPI